MHSLGKYIRNHFLIFISIIILIFVVNIVLFILAFQGIISSNYGVTDPCNVLNKTANLLEKSNDKYSLPQSQIDFLEKNNIWGMLISPKGQTVWELNLPKEIPSTYTLQDISIMSRGYIHDYPLFFWNCDDKILVLGYPKSSYSKILTNYLPISMIRRIPLFFLGIMALDIILLFFAYAFSKHRITKNTIPIVDAITKLSQGQPVALTMKGDLSEVGDILNKTSDILNRKDISRANWISGVSHDIRTPLSMIMGYADRIAENNTASCEIQEQAVIIRNQSLRLKELIQDLNLVSQLEYDMQPLQIHKLRPAKLIRELVTEYLNSGLDKKYSIDLDIATDAQSTTISGDERLLIRALRNLIQNSINHNPAGCSITIKMFVTLNTCNISVSDNGKGVSKLQLESILNKPHYMNSTDERMDLRHGLGIMLVKQIIAVHYGVVIITSQVNKGFKVLLQIPLNQN